MTARKMAPVMESVTHKGLNGSPEGPNIQTRSALPKPCDSHSVYKTQSAHWIGTGTLWGKAQITC